MRHLVISEAIDRSQSEFKAPLTEDLRMLVTVTHGWSDGNHTAVLRPGAGCGSGAATFAEQLQNGGGVGCERSVSRPPAVY